tara:strand:+ start:70 stop:312 length:243 start_codon:yes stop_codon:yes gene_type:complete
MKNFIINSLSIFAAKRFARIWRNPRKTTSQKMRALDLYRSLRRKLPLKGFNHLGNHESSKYRPYLATQGCSVPVFSHPCA